MVGKTTQIPPNRMIGVALGPRTTAEAIAGIRSVARSADIAEIRLDYMDECDLPALLRDRPCPVIVTNRAEREGGRFRGSESERLRPLLEAIDLGVDYVDIEHDAAHLLEDRQDTKLVVSRHDFERIPDDITEVHRRLAGKGADVVKIVGMAQRLTDNIRILQALALSDLPMIGIAMGEAGLISRILALKHGSCFLTYATLEEDKEVAPGQLPVETMRNVYRAKKIGAETAVYGVLSARHISDSLVSGLNSATRDAGLDAIWLPFVASEARDDDPADVIRAFRSLGVAGYVVEGSAQASAGASLDAISSSNSAGGINVIRIVDGRTIGEWSDAPEEAFWLVIGRQTALASKERREGCVSS